MMTTSIHILFLSCIALLFWLFRRSGYNKHRYNIKKAYRILSKINAFEYPGQKINYLRKIDPFVFEELLLNAFVEQGYRIKRNSRYTGDGGIDGMVFNTHGDQYLIQAKRYQSYINPEHVRQFQTLVAETKSQGGFFIHTGKTGKTSFSYQGATIQIISGSKLLELINGTNTNLL